MTEIKTAEKVIDEMIAEWQEIGIAVTKRARDKAVEHKKDISLARPTHGLIGHKSITRSLPTLGHLS